MAFAVVLTLDSDTTNAVRDLWQTRTAEGLPPTLSELGAPPHLTFAVYDTVEPDVLGHELAAFADEQPPIAKAFSAVGTFPTAESVVYLASTVTADLLALHVRLYRRIEKLGFSARAYCYIAA